MPKKRTRSKPSKSAAEKKQGGSIINLGKSPKLINPDWEKDTPCIPTSVMTPSGPNKLTIREAVQRVDDVRQYCITKSPGFASVAASVRHIVLTPASNMFQHVAFTDGWNVWYGGGFFKETTKAQAAIVIHEVLHVALRHPQRGLALYKDRGSEFGGDKFNPLVWNFAVDCVVNLSTFTLKWVEHPSCGVVEFTNTIDPSLLENWPPHKWSAEKLYVHLMREQEKNGGTEDFQVMMDRAKAAMDKLRNGNQDGEGESDPHAMLGDLATIMGEARPDTEAESRNWHSRVERAAAGEAPGGVMREACFDLPASPTPWQNVLRSYMCAHVMPKTEPHTYKPGRNMMSLHAVGADKGFLVPFDPGIQPQKGIKKMAVCIDTSGSITEDILTYFCSELQAIRNRVGADLILIACDADCDDPIYVSRHENLIDKIKYRGGLRGGGGTDFRPAVKAAEQLPGVAVIAYLTDMMGPFPDECSKPLVWAATCDPHEEPPVGRVIRIMDV